MIESIKIFLGLFFSYFLKDINFLSLQFSFINSEIIYPDFLIIFLIFFSLKKSESELLPIWIGFLAGLLEDSTILKFSKKEYTPILGIHTLIYPFVCYTIAKFKKIIYANDNDNAFQIIIITFLSTFIARSFVWFMTGIMDTFYQSYSLFATSLYTSLLSPIWFLFLNWIFLKNLKG